MRLDFGRDRHSEEQLHAEYNTTMRALLQRVTQAGVRLPSGERRAIGPGLVVFLGVGRGDGPAQAK